MIQPQPLHFELAYGNAVLQHGLTKVPSLLIRHHKALGLKRAEFVFLCNLISQSDSAFTACPSIKRMAKDLGVSPTTLHAAEKALIEKGFIAILPVRNKFRTNTYNLLPLREKLDQLAKVMLPHADKVDAAEPKATNGQ